MGHGATLDYATYTKGGVLMGIGLFMVGEIGQIALPSLVGPLPSWELSLLTWLTGIGILLAILAPIVFGIVVPLTE